MHVWWWRITKETLDTSYVSSINDVSLFKLHNISKKGSNKNLIYSKVKTNYIVVCKAYIILNVVFGLAVGTSNFFWLKFLGFLEMKQNYAPLEALTKHPAGIYSCFNLTYFTTFQINHKNSNKPPRTYRRCI